MEFGRTITLEADHITTSQLGSNSNKCGQRFTNKYGHNLSASIAQPVWAAQRPTQRMLPTQDARCRSVTTLRSDTVSLSDETDRLFFSHDATVDSKILKLNFNLK